MGVVLKRTEMFVFVVGLYACSPRIRLASKMSFSMMVTRLAWMAHKLASSNSLTRYASATSWRHRIATDWNRRCVLKSWAISLTNLWKGSFRMSSAEVFWKWQMSCRATVPALYRWGLTCLPCILPSWIFLFCSSVQSNTRCPSMVLSFVREMYSTGSFLSIGGKLCPSCVVLCEAPLVLVVHFRPSSCAC